MSDQTKYTMSGNLETCESALRESWEGCFSSTLNCVSEMRARRVYSVASTDNEIGMIIVTETRIGVVEVLVRLTNADAEISEALQRWKTLMLAN